MSPLPFIFDNLVHRTLLTYLTARAGNLPRGLIGGTDLDALKTLLIKNPAPGERYDVTEDEMRVLLEAVKGVLGG